MFIESSVGSTPPLTRINAVAGSHRDSTTAFRSAVSNTKETKEEEKASHSRSTTQELLGKLNEYIEKGPIVAM